MHTSISCSELRMLRCQEHKRHGWHCSEKGNLPLRCRDLKDRHRRRQELARTRAVRAVSSQPAKPRGSPAVISQLPPSLPLRPLLPWGSGQAAASPAGWHALPCPWPLPTLQGLNLLHLQFFDLFWFPFF